MKTWLPASKASSIESLEEPGLFPGSGLLSSCTVSTSAAHKAAQASKTSCPGTIIVITSLLLFRDFFETSLHLGGQLFLCQLPQLGAIWHCLRGLSKVGLVLTTPFGPFKLLFIVFVWHHQILGLSLQKYLIITTRGVHNPPCRHH